MSTSPNEPNNPSASEQAAQHDTVDMPEAKTVNIPVVAILALVVACASLFMSWQQSRQASKQSIKVVDLAEMSRFYQEQARQQGLKDGVTAEQRAQILQTLQMKMNVLQKTVDEYVHSCGCNIWVKSAIVGRNEQVEDITPIIMGLVDKQIAQSTPILSNPPATSLPIPSANPNAGQVQDNSEAVSPAFPSQ